MNSETALEHLHDQATRGGTLTEAERARLEAGYAQKDQGEAALLGAFASDNSLGIDSLRDDLTLAVTRLRERSQQLEAQAIENDVLRREVDALSKQLLQTRSRQAV